MTMLHELSQRFTFTITIRAFGINDNRSSRTRMPLLLNTQAIFLVLPDEFVVVSVVRFAVSKVCTLHRLVSVKIQHLLPI